MEAVMVYVTASDIAEARRIGRAVVEARLAACANVIGGMTAIYRWQGAVEEGEEAMLILKTRRELIEALTARIGELHGYEIPCVAVLPIVGGNAAYIDWIGAETPGG